MTAEKLHSLHILSLKETKISPEHCFNVTYSYPSFLPLGCFMARNYQNYNQCGTCVVKNQFATTTTTKKAVADK